MTAYPDVVANGNGQSIDVEQASVGLHAMPCGIEPHVGTNEAVVADTYLGNVEHRTIVIGMEVVAHMNVLPEVAMEVVGHERIAADGTEQLPQDYLLLCLVGQGKALSIITG